MGAEIDLGDRARAAERAVRPGGDPDEAVQIQPHDPAPAGRQALDQDLARLVGEVGEPQDRPVRPLIGDRLDQRALGPFGRQARPPGRRRHAAQHMVARIDAAAAPVEPGLGERHLGIDQAELADRRREGDRVDPAGRHVGDVAELPGGAEQAALARVHAGERDPAVLRIAGRRGAVGIVAGAERAGPDPIGLAAGEGAGAGDHMGQRFQRLHHRDVVGGMHDRAGGVDHEIQQLGRRPLAVQLGEIREHAAAERLAGEGGARRAVDLGGLGAGRPDAAGQGAFQIRGRADRQLGELDAGLLDGIPDPRQIALHDGGISRWPAVLVAAGEHRLQHQPGAGRLGHRLEHRQHLAALADPRVVEREGRDPRAGQVARRAVGDPAVERTDEELWRQRLDRREIGEDRGPLLRRQAEPDRRHPARPAADREMHRLRPAAHGHARRRAVDRQPDRLLAHLAGRQRVGPGQRERADIGLVGGVRPVAMVLHLEGIALHGAGHLDARQDLVGQGAQVLERAHRVDPRRERRLRPLAVGMEHLDRAAGDAGQGMEHDEAGPVGHEVGGGDRLALEGQAAIRAALDPGAVAQLLLGVLADRVVADLEALAGLADLQVLDLGVVGAPIAVAHDERDRPDRLLAADLDVTEIAAVELHRERARPQHPERGDALLGAEQSNRARWSGGHGAPLRTDWHGLRRSIAPVFGRRPGCTWQTNRPSDFA